MNNDKIVSAFLQYKNTQLPDINLSPAQILFHRKLKDNIPSIHSHYHLNKEWIVAGKLGKFTGKYINSKACFVECFAQKLNYSSYIYVGLGVQSRIYQFLKNHLMFDVWCLMTFWETNL